MGTEIQGEYTVSETEVDFAMKYAEERRKSQKLEKRLHGLMYETMAQHEACVELVDSIARADGDRTTYLMKKLTEWRSDLEAMVYLNLFVAVGDEAWLRDHHIKYKALDDLPPGVFEKIKERLGEYAKGCFEEWLEFAKSRGMTPTGMIRMAYLTELAKTVKETMKSQGFDPKEVDQAVKH